MSEASNIQEWPASLQRRKFPKVNIPLWKSLEKFDNMIDQGIVRVEENGNGVSWPWRFETPVRVGELYLFKDNHLFEITKIENNRMYATEVVDPS